MSDFRGVAGRAGGNAYGTIPNLPAPVSTAGQTTTQAMQLGNQVYNQLPGYASSLGNIGANIGAETAGMLPADVKYQLQQGAAERGVMTGAPGSPNSDAAYLRALGLTSLDLTQRGQNNLLATLPSLPGANIYQNPGFYVNAPLAQETASANAIYQSAPDPRAAAGAAMGAINAGLNAGRSAVPGVAAPSVPGWNGGAWNPGGGGGGSNMVTGPAGGSVIGGESYANGQVPIDAQPQANIDRILQSYAGTATGAGAFGSSVAQETGPDYEGQNLWESGGSQPSGGFYYSGDENDFEGAANDYYGF